MSHKKSIKEIKAELSANKKKLDEVNHPNRKHFHSTLGKNRLSKELKELDKQRQDELDVVDEETDDYEKSEQTKEQQEEKTHTKHMINNSFSELLKNENKVLKKKMKKKKHSRSMMLIATVIIPILLIIVLFFMSIWLLIIMNLDDGVATIAGLADPKERAMLQAQGLLGNSALTNIPNALLGDLPNGDNSSSDNSKSKSKSKGFVDVSGDPKTDMGKAKLVAEFLKKNTDFTDAQIAGVLGNFEAESHFNSMIIEGHPFDTTKSMWEAAIKNYDPNKELGLGLGQWTWTRGSHLLSYSKSHNEDPGAILTQMKFALAEKEAGFGTKDWSFWKDYQNDPGNAAEAMTYHWEKPGDMDNQAVLRAASARKLYPTVKKWLD